MLQSMFFVFCYSILLFFILNTSIFFSISKYFVYLFLSWTSQCQKLTTMLLPPELSVSMLTRQTSKSLIYPSIEKYMPENFRSSIQILTKQISQNRELDGQMENQLVSQISFFLQIVLHSNLKIHSRIWVCTQTVDSHGKNM